MKIIYLHQYFATPDSSGGIRSYLIAKKLTHKGHDVHVITSSAFLPVDIELKAGWNSLTIDDINVHVLKLPYSNNMSVRKRLGAFLSFLVRSTSKAASLSADLIYATSTPLTIAIPALVLSKTKKIPFVFEVRDVWPDIPVAMGYLKNKLMIKLSYVLESLAYRYAKKIIALSDGMKKRIVEKGVSSGKVIVVPNFADVNMFDDSRSDGEQLESFPQYLSALKRPLIVYTGTLGHVNNVGYLLKVAAQIQEKGRDVAFAIIGDGKEKEELVEMAQKLAVLDNSVFFYPPVRKHELPAILRFADAACSTVLPLEELWDNSANKFFDTLAAGKPMFINHLGWQADVIIESGCGMVLDHADVKSAANSIIEFFDDPARVERARKESKRLAIEEYDAGILTNKVASELESVVCV